MKYFTEYIFSSTHQANSFAVYQPIGKFFFNFFDLQARCGMRFWDFVQITYNLKKRSKAKAKAKAKAKKTLRAI